MSRQQKIITSISGSVLGHLLLLIGVFIALTSNAVTDSQEGAKEKETGPKEVTVMLSDLMEQIEPPPTVLEQLLPQQKKFVNTDGNVTSATKPENATYESDRNTVAASKLQPDTNIPQSEGVTMRGNEQVETLELRDQNFSEDRLNTRQSAARAIMKSPNEKVFSDVNSRSTAREKIGVPQNATNGALVVTRKNSVNGTLSNKGEDAVDAVETPLGRYKKAVTDAVAKKWHKYRKQSTDPITWGTLRLKFTINPAGKVLNLEVTENEGNELLLDLTLKAIAEAEFEPMSDEVAAQLGASGLAMKYDVIIY